MFKKVAPYIGEYKKYTVLAAIMMIIEYVNGMEVVQNWWKEKYMI